MQIFTEREEELNRLWLEMFEENTHNLLIIAETTRYDKVFWTDVFIQYLPTAKPHFIQIKSKLGNPTDGNKAVLSNYATINRKLFANKNILFCLDSDYNYLAGHQFFDNNEMLLQTYFYAIENHNSLAAILNKVARTSFNITNFDFKLFLATYSEIIFDVFCYIIFFEKRYQEAGGKKPEEFNHTSIAEKIGLGKNRKIDLTNNAANELDILKENIKAFIQILAKKYPIDHKIIATTLCNKIKPTDTFLYINGHILKDYVVVPLFEQFKKETINIQLGELRKQLSDKKEITIDKKEKELQNFYKNQLEILTSNYKEYWLDRTASIENSAMLQIQKDINSKNLHFIS